MEIVLKSYEIVPGGKYYIYKLYELINNEHYLFRRNKENKKEERKKTRQRGGQGNAWLARSLGLAVARLGLASCLLGRSRTEPLGRQLAIFLGRLHEAAIDLARIEDR
jgi:hypothetical protein